MGHAQFHEATIGGAVKCPTYTTEDFYWKIRYSCSGCRGVWIPRVCYFCIGQVSIWKYHFCLFFIFSLVSNICAYLYDSKAFLFSLAMPSKPGWEPVKLPQTGSLSYKKKHSIFSCKEFGPTFGIYDLNIQETDNEPSTSLLGHIYNLPTGHKDYGRYTLYLAGTYKFKPTEIETFYETTT